MGRGGGVGVGGDAEQVEDLVLEWGEGGLEDLDGVALVGEVVAGDAVEDFEDSGGAGGGA